MTRRLAVVALVCITFLTGSVQAGVVLDAFNSDQAYVVEAQPSHHSVSGFGGVSDVLGERTLSASMTLPMRSLNWVKTSIGLLHPGELSFQSSYLLASRSVSGHGISYGNDTPLGIDLSSYHTLQLTVLYDHAPKPNVIHWQMNIDGKVAEAQHNFGEQVLEWQQHQFSGVDFSNVKKISIDYHLTPVNEWFLEGPRVALGEFRAVPEPSSFALMGLAGIGLGIGILCRRRRA